jgi:hypothetical protein
MRELKGVEECEIGSIRGEGTALGTFRWGGGGI